MTEELKKIKKLYGEEMMHLCRDLFPDILEEEGTLLEILQDNFYPTHHLGHDIKINCVKREFRGFILDRYKKESSNDSLFKTNSYAKWELEKYGKINIKAPFQMLSGLYDIYECKTEKDVKSFAKYYAPGEQICTLDGGRLYFSHIFFFVKKNVDSIKREDFPNPKREDEYSTSVLCVQFNRNKPNYVTIISRYNNAVDNPNFTYYNDLDNIYPGLTESFKKYYGFSFKREPTGIKFLADMKYFQANDGKFYKYSHEKHGLLFCDNNIVLKWHYPDFEYTAKERYIFMDEYILDRKEKRLFVYPSIFSHYHSFLTTTMIGEKIIKTDYVIKDDKKIITIYFEDDKYVIIATNMQNEIIYYENKFVKLIKNKFLEYNETMKYLNIPNCRKIRNKFMNQNNSVIEINAPLLMYTGDDFMPVNTVLKRFYTPNLKSVGDRFLSKNRNFTKKDCINYFDNYDRYNHSGVDRCELCETINKQRSRTIDSFRE